ncbi:huntingtin-interacting protein K-like [Watersipora subatra]|uniref:huntingtin-interacting protein K-like n=1 Tax=Watersipora subatra TaxID=2589382 RepID=UPI00355B67FB
MSSRKAKSANVEDDHAEEEQGKSFKGKHNDGAADLEKVTDFVEEQEISAQDIQKTLKLVLARKQEQAMQLAAREKELAKVKVKQEDIDLIVHEMEISKSVAERKLKQHQGNVVEALIELTN